MVESAQYVTGSLLKGPGKICTGINIGKWQQLGPEHLLPEIKQN